MTATTVSPSPRQLGLLRTASLGTATGAILQLLLGGFQITAQNPTILTIHGIVGLLTILAGVIATVAGFVNRGRGGNPGLAFHALGTTVLLLVQYALGEMGGFMIAHIVIGIVILGSAVAMATLAIRKPLAR